MSHNTLLQSYDVILIFMLDGLQKSRIFYNYINVQKMTGH